MSKLWTSILSRLQAIFDPETLSELIVEWLGSLIVGLIIILVFYLIWRIVRLILLPSLVRSGVDETTTSFVETAVKYTIIIIGLVTALDSAGIQTSAVLASLGIAGLTIGFAARDALSNLISGILIFLDRPFVIGDLVEVEDKYGRVERITLRSTRIITSDGKMLAVPNTEVINKTVASYTNFPTLRLDIPVTVGVTENLAEVRRILLDLVIDHPNFLANPAPRVVVQALNDYNVAMELQAWLIKEREHVEQRFELRERVFNALNESGVDMPFETIQVRPLQVNWPNGEAPA
jgi:small conductance mechanosensitive channel